MEKWPKKVTFQNAWGSLFFNKWTNCKWANFWPVSRYGYMGNILKNTEGISFKFPSVSFCIFPISTHWQNQAHLDSPKGILRPLFSRKFHTISRNSGQGFWNRKIIIQKQILVKQSKFLGMLKQRKCQNWDPLSPKEMIILAIVMQKI